MGHVHVRESMKRWQTLVSNVAWMTRTVDDSFVKQMTSKVFLCWRKEWRDLAKQDTDLEQHMQTRRMQHHIKRMVASVIHMKGVMTAWQSHVLRMVHRDRVVNTLSKRFSCLDQVNHSPMLQVLRGWKYSAISSRLTLRRSQNKRREALSLS